MARRKRSKKNNSISIHRGVSIGFLILSFFSLTQLGFVGRVCANMTRFFVGDSYLFFSFFILVMSLITLVKGEIKKIQNKRRAFGALLLYLSVLVLLHALMFQKVTNPYLQPVPATWRFFFSDLTQNVTGNNLGGGMIGALIYGVFYFLFDQVGTYFIIALLLLTAVLLIFNISYGQFFQRISSWLEDLLEGVKKKRQKKAVNKKNKTSKKAQDLKDTSSLQESQKEAGKIPIDSHQRWHFPSPASWRSST